MIAFFKQFRLPKITWKRKDFVALLYWFISILIWELVCHFVCFKGFSFAALYIFPFSALFALIMTFLMRLCSEKWNKRWTVILTVILIVFYGSQIVYNRVFTGFFSIRMVKMGGTAVTKFWKETFLSILSSWWKILILFVPIPLHILRLKRFPRTFTKRSWDFSVIFFALIVVSWALCVLSLRIGGTKRHSPFGAYHSSTIVTKESVNKLGMMTTMRLEITELLFPSDHNDDLKLVVTRLPKVDTEVSSQEGTPFGSNTDRKLNFEDLDTYTYDERVLDLNKYFSFMRPTSKTLEYSGRFDGMNLIELCAESYSPVFIDEELTPILYQLTHEGLVFTNYYTSFENTTTNCEYSLCTGLFPDMSRNKFDSSFVQSIGHSLPYCVGNAFKNQKGYKTLFFHNNVGTFYHRNETHPNMGFDCYFKKENAEDPDEVGMVFTTEGEPTSDLEMVQQSMKWIDEAGEPFVAYYMTYSGHYKYDYDTNPMCRKNREIVEEYVAKNGLEYSETVQAYISCNLELEYALEYLIDALRERDMLDRTVIVMTGDHFPYGLSNEYDELLRPDGTDPFARMKNSLIIWPGYMEGKEPVVVDTYCCNIDILPTILNLFGIQFDSRLLAGVDIFSDGPHMAIFWDESFITDVMTFDSTNNQITYHVDEETVPKNYFDSAVQIIQNKMNMSNQVLYTNYYGLITDKKHYVAPEEDRKSAIAPGWIVLVSAAALYAVLKIGLYLLKKRKAELAKAANQDTQTEQDPEKQPEAVSKAAEDSEEVPV